MQRKFLYLLMVIVLAMAFVVTACAVQAPAPPAGEEPAAPAEEVVEITWLQWWEKEWGPEFHGKLIADFEAAHPNIKVTVVETTYSDMPTKLQSDAAGKGTTYDLFGLGNEWMSGLDKHGYLEDLDPWLEADPEFDARLTTTTPMRFKGKTKGLCLYLIPYQFAYNVDIFEEKGLEPPTNWDEMVQVLEALRDEEAGTYGMSISLTDPMYSMTRYFGFRLAQEGGRWVDEDGNPAFNSPEGIATLQWWKDFYDSGLLVPGSISEDLSMNIEFVGSGQVATSIQGPFVWEMARQIDPDIRMAYAPAFRAKTGGYSWDCSGMGINANSPHKEEAWEFFRYIYSDEVSVKMGAEKQYVWATNAAITALEGSDDPFLKEIPAMSNQDPEHNLRFPVLTQPALDAFLLAFQQGVVGEKDPQTALDEAAAIWQEEFEKLE